MFAALRKLPIIFICENNGLACVTDIALRQPPVEIWRRASACGVASVRVDATDLEAVCGAMAEATARVRAHEGPMLLECMVERFAAHCEIPGIPPRRTGTAIASNDPITLMGGWVTEREKKDLVARIGDELERALAFARSSPFPTGLRPATSSAIGGR
jgi:TPP-dependent pyruvate/acetoin dehydrogenase alpha subunit